MAKAKKTSRKLPAQSSRKAHGAARARKVLDRLDKAAAFDPAVELTPEAVAGRKARFTARLRTVRGQLDKAIFGAVPTCWGTPQLAAELRTLAVKRPSVGLLLNAAADRLDWYAATDRLIVAERIAALPHSQDARKAAMDGLQADALTIHRRQNAARWARLSGQDVAKALGAEPAGKAPTRAAAAHAARTPPRKARR
jgi:hypothetical protein